MNPYCGNCTRRHTCEPHTMMDEHGHCDEKRRMTPIDKMHEIVSRPNSSEMYSFIFELDGKHYMAEWKGTKGWKAPRPVEFVK